MVIFDTDRCFERKHTRFDLLSIEDMDDYSEAFWFFLKNNFKAVGQTFEVSINRIERKFRIVIHDKFLDGFDPKDLSAYENGNVKPAEAFFHLLNYGISNLKAIPNFSVIPEKLDFDGLDSVLICDLPKIGSTYSSRYGSMFNRFRHIVMKTTASQNRLSEILSS